MVNEWQGHTPSVARLAKRLVKHSLGEMDALHLATAEVAKCGRLLTTDLTLIKRAHKVPGLSVQVVNPMEFILEDIP